MLIVVPNGAWVGRLLGTPSRWRGPATHAIDPLDPAKTLCGKNPEGWDYEDGDIGIVSCKVCRKKIGRGSDD